MNTTPPAITEKPSWVYHTARFKSLDDGRCRVLCGRSPVPCAGLVGYAWPHDYTGQLADNPDEDEMARAMVDNLIAAFVPGPGMYWLVRGEKSGYSRDQNGAYYPILGKKGANGKRIQNRDGSPRVRARLPEEQADRWRPISESRAIGLFPILPAVINCPDCRLPIWVPIPPCEAE